MKFKRSSLSILISALITGCMTPYSFAQDDNEVKKAQAVDEEEILSKAKLARDTKAKEASDSIEHIIINGYEASLDAADLNKKSAEEFLDSISASGLGEFAEDSVGEALNNTPGVNLNSSLGAADGIYIGGLPPEYNQIQMNGVTMGAGTNDSDTDQSVNAVSTGIFSTSVLAGVDVYKSARADRQEGALGGTVNFKTWKPLNFKKTKFNINATVGIQEISEDPDGKLSFLYGDRTDDGNFGWVLTAAHDVKKARVDTSLNNIKLIDYDGSHKEEDNPLEGIDTLQAQTVNYSVREAENVRDNVIAALQYQFNEDIVMELQGSYAKYSRTMDETKISYGLGGNGYANNAVIFEPVHVDGQDLQYLSAGVKTSYNDKVNMLHRESVDEANGINFKLDWIISANLDLSFKASHAFNSYSWDPLTKAHQGVENEKHPILYSKPLGQDYPEIYALKNDAIVDGEFNYAQYEDFDITDRSTWGGVIRPDGAPLNEYTWSNQSGSWKENSVESNNVGLDFTYYFDTLPVLTTLKFGVHYTERTNEAMTLSSADKNSGLPSSAWKGSATVEDFGGEVEHDKELFGGHNLQGVPLTIPEWEWDDFASGLWDSGAGSWQGLGQSNLPSLTRLDKQQYKELATSAAYAMASFDFAGIVGNVGVRYVYDKTNTEAYNRKLDENNDPIQLDSMLYLPEEISEYGTAINYNAVAAWNNPDNFTKLSYGNTRNNVLPSFNVRYEITEGILIRAAAALTMSRPSFANSNAKTTYNLDDSLDFGNAVIVDLRNPNMEPTFSRNYNLGIEWYQDDIGSVALAYRHKNLRNVRGRQRFIIEGTSEEISDLFPNLPYDTETVILSMNTTDGKGKSDSVELSMRHKFSYLTAPVIQNVGFSFNTTYTDATITRSVIASDRKIEMPKSSPLSFNSQVYYQDKGITARLAYIWREPTIVETRNVNFTNLNKEKGYVRNLNFSSSYKFTKNFKMSFNIKNVLNNDVTRGYEDLDWLNHRAYIGRTYMLTGSYTMK